MELMHDFNPNEDAVLDVDAVAALEQSLAASGTPLSALMDRAGASIAALVRALAPLENAHAPWVLVLCGPGNNGGDGWVCARILAEEGYRVAVIATRTPSLVKAQPARGAALASEASLQALGMPVEDASRDDVVRLFAEADVVVDALLGTGFSGDSLAGTIERLVRACNESESLVVAADVPSGLSAQTGQPARPCVEADYTVTMLAAKTGLVRNLEACGRLLVAPLSTE